MLRARGIGGAELGFERGERLRPGLVQPLAQRAQAVRVDVVDAARAFGAIDDEPSLLQDLEMLRDGGAAHRKGTRELANGRRAFVLQALEHLAACRVGKRGQGHCVSHSLR